MEKTIVEFCKKCLTCKRSKLRGDPQSYGKLPPRDMQVVDPFDVVHVETMGPYGGEPTRWLEVSIQSDNHARTTAENFDTTWLCHYPRPKEAIFDRGNEFNTSEFREILASYAIKPVPISVKNPQANVICERVHLVLNNCIRCYPESDWRQVIQYAAFSVRASYHSIIGTTAAHLILGQDLITRKLHEANWNYLSKRRFDEILKENDRETTKRLQHFYHVGDHVMIAKGSMDKLQKGQLQLLKFMGTE
ncbi:Pol protein [Phytophthora palmivora]|uniref:Pol protein n=1 Tax=Phytophthora palmivora TaxID=4796 RepID=A0A2P4Y916_9STRA|nr:Pol protein [Phytophthora palmivora]